MSKAFTREGDASEEDDDSPVAEVPGGKNYVTRKGYSQLQVELKQLVEVERPTLVQTVSWAAANGDRSENGDYIYGKKRLREIDRRIRFLMKRMESATVVDPSSQGQLDRVYFGATVKLRQENDDEAVFQIVGVDEADATRGLISWLAPMARALLKARIGDIVSFDSPAGPREIEILDIRYEP